MGLRDAFGVGVTQRGVVHETKHPWGDTFNASTTIPDHAPHTSALARETIGIRLRL